jgi:F-type H+-transporting ATPase subunit gamma
VSKRRGLEQQLQAFGDIKDILGAMKNLALMEMRKLTQFLSTQRRVVETMESASTDFLSFYPYPAGEAVNARNVYLVIGSERGFCGDFNETMRSALETYLEGVSPEEVWVIAVGYRLSAKPADAPRVVARIAGASVVEEVGSVLTRLIETLDVLHDRAPVRPRCLTVLSHEAEEAGVRISVLEPFKRLEHKRVPPYAYPPLLNLTPPRALTGLADQYLFAKLHELFYSSLMAENLQRLQHMENAIRRIEQESAELLLRRNMLRQEEITEEIEVLMLGAEALE